AALLLFIGAFPFALFAQTGVVKGKLIDSTGQSLNSATISVSQKKDSSLVNYTLSDSKGTFEIKNLAIGDYHLFVSFTGYEVFTTSFSISAKKRTIDLVIVMMEPEYKTLTGVVISDASPVKIKGDTISFKANAFNARPEASVEDVLKKLPGVQVQKDGSIKAQGEQVQKVYVDGKEFFGNDPKIATKNLTADMVDQIQVFDDMSEQARFTKIDDGSRTKSINIKLKKDKRKGDFGRATAGAGTQSRYEGNFSINHFRGDRRISLVGSANNTNKQNYTFNDYSSAGGGGSQFGNGGGTTNSMINASGASQGGVSRPLSAGINFNDSWGPKIDFRASYFYSDNSNTLIQNKFRRNTFPGDSASETTTYNYFLNNNRSHRINGRWEYMIDTTNSILYTLNFNKQLFEGETIDTSVTMSDGINKYLAVKASTDKYDERDGISYTGELLYRKKFKKVGRTFTLGWRNSKGDNNSENIYRSPVTTYDSYDSVVSVINVNQQGNQDNESGNNIISSSYTEPIGRNKLFEINYAYSNSENVSDKKTYDYNSGSGKYDIINKLQTNHFEYNNVSSRVGFNFRHQLKKLNYQFGLSYHVTNLENRNITPEIGIDTIIRQRFTNLFPTANFNYAFTRSKNIRIYYRGRTNSPTTQQLQNVPDVSNPLLIKIGNPSLKQEFVHNANISYNSYALASQNFFSGNLHVTYTGNKIVNSMDSLGAVTIVYKPENMNGSFNGSGMVSIGIPVKKAKGLNINLTNMMYLSRDANILYKEKNFTTIFQVNQSAGLNYGKENFDMSVSAAFVYNTVAYNLNKTTNTKYFSHAYSADFTYRLENRCYFLTDLDYYINGGRTEGFNEDVLLWNLSVAKKFFQTNTAEIKFTIYDILKQNKGINRIIGENYFEDIRANVVPRFFMLSISFNLNRFNGDSRNESTSHPGTLK
ncbi:MAG TPA: TonB-dependent receptor, partial [Chitinophagaceae bacterium]|nr:TonB-dependent receptor [Chitinophagaceae bacterium]